MGKDLVRWKSLVDTKSKSLVRRTLNDAKRPTHLEILQYIFQNYKAETIGLAQRISTLSPEKIEEIVELSSENQLHIIKKKLICKFLNTKIDMLKQVADNILLGNYLKTGNMNFAILMKLKMH